MPLRHLPWGRPAQRAMWCISPAGRRCGRQRKPGCAASACMSNRCCRIFCWTRLYAERPGVEGMKHVMSPPLRDERNLPAAVGRAQSGPDRHRGHGSLPVRHGAEASRRGRLHADSQRDSRHRRPRESACTPMASSAANRSAPIRGRAQHSSREALRTVSAQGNHRRRVGRRSGRLRHASIAAHLRGRRSTSTMITADSKGFAIEGRPVGGHGARQGAGAGRRVCGRAAAAAACCAASRNHF